jgi:hypothetical protein
VEKSVKVLNDLNWIMCVMQKKIMKKLKNIIYNLSVKECKFFMKNVANGERWMKR